MKECTEKIINEGFKLGVALKKKNATEYAKARLTQITQGYVKINDRLECLLELAVYCHMQLPMEIIYNEDEEIRNKDVIRFMIGLNNGLIR